MAKKLTIGAMGLACAGMCVSTAAARRVSAEMFIDDFQAPRAAFIMLDTPVVAQDATGPRQAVPAYLSSSNIAAIDDGALVIDADSGHLVRVDDKGNPTSELNIGFNAAQLTVDRESKRAYVSDRDGDRVVIVAFGRGLSKLAAIKTHAEPYGVALTPDRKTLLVVTVADRQLTAYSTSSRQELWSVEIGPEGRGLAISPSGKEAMVTFLNTSAVARIPLSGESHQPRFVPLDRSVTPAPQMGAAIFAPQVKIQALGKLAGPNVGANAMPAVTIPSPDTGRHFSRAAFTATYIRNDVAVVPHQESTPQLATSGMENTGVYGGGGSFERPIEHRLAFLATSEGGFEKMAKAEISTHQPRALAYDASRDLLYVAGYGSDTIHVLGDASQPSIFLKGQTRIGNAGDPCGPSGLDINDKGDLVAFCSLDRRVATLHLGKAGAMDINTGKSVAKSRFSPAAQRGRAMFRMGQNAQMSTGGVMACESCHPEGRTDGLSWRISGMALNTPLLAGKVMGTHPFKWDGADKDIKTSLTHTVKRLGGTGINESQAADIAAYLAELPKTRAPSVADAHAVARGKKLFTSKEVGCTSCHSGKMRTNRQTYDLADDLGKVDTPALIGLANSAPYYHDGSATTLRALLLENGTIHGMGNVSQLSDAQVGDLVSYLQTL